MIKFNKDNEDTQYLYVYIDMCAYNQKQSIRNTYAKYKI